MRIFLIILAVYASVSTVQAQNVEPPMTMARMGEILLTIDPEARASQNAIEMTLAGWFDSCDCGFCGDYRWD